MLISFVQFHPQQRAVQAESQVNQLKRENRRLQVISPSFLLEAYYIASLSFQDEVKSLHESLRHYSRQNIEHQPRILSETAQELQSAADSAERSIRYVDFCDLIDIVVLRNLTIFVWRCFTYPDIVCRDLLAGVERLRVVAASIESMEKIEEVRHKHDRDKN